MRVISALCFCYELLSVNCVLNWHSVVHGLFSVNKIFCICEK